MSIEGMWAARLGDGLDEQVSNSVIVLDGDRLFGGDPTTAYLGKYQVTDGIIVAQFDTWVFCRAIASQNPFGRVGAEREACKMVARHEPNEGAMGVISGKAWRLAHPDVKIPVYMVKIAELSEPANKPRLHLVKGVE